MGNLAENLIVGDDWMSVKGLPLEEVYAITDTLRTNGTWTEIIGGLTGFSVQFDPKDLCPDKAKELLIQQLSDVSTRTQASAATVSLPVCYNPTVAPDILDVADAMGVSFESFVEWHSNQDFSVTMLGFMPGFAYLQCDSTVPDIGRLPQPRKKVPAGSIGMIGDQSCIYSFDSPGGWPIIGKTSLTLFDPKRNPEALLAAGQIVKFFPISLSELSESS